jgi:hypothetical protein
MKLQSLFFGSVLVTHLFWANVLCAASSLSPSETACGTLSTPDQVDEYCFSALGGETVMISMATDFGCEIELRLGNTVLTNVPSVSYTAMIEAFTLGTAGTYTIACRSLPDSTAGDYCLTLIKYSSTNNGTISPGNTTTNVLGLGDVDAYSFSGTNGETVRVVMGSYAYSSFQVELRNSSGVLLTNATALGFSATIESYQLTNSGAFILMCRPLDGFGPARGVEYGLTLINYSRINTGAIEAGETVVGVVGLGDIDAYSFSGNGGDAVTILMGADSPWSAEVELHTEDGGLLKKSQDPFFSGSIEAYKLTKSGTFVIVCRSIDGVTGVDTLNYGLTLIKNPGPNGLDPFDLDGGFIADGETKEGLATLGDIDAFNFSGAAGDKVNISAVSGGFDAAQIELHGPAGNVLATSVVSSITMCLPFTGTYLILARSVTGSFEVGYQLTFNRSPIPVIPPNDPYPHLVIQNCYTNISVWWLTNTSGFRLQSATNLNFPINWMDLVREPQIIEDKYSLDFEASKPAEFFRLFHP